MIMRLVPRTILGQLIAGTVAVQALVFAVFLAIGGREQYRDTESHNRERLLKQTHILAALSAQALRNSNRGELDAVFRSVNLTIALKGARLTDGDGHTLLTSSGRISTDLGAEELRLLPRVWQGGDYVAVSHPLDGDISVMPVQVDGLPRGIVWLYGDPVTGSRTLVAVLQYALTYAACALVGNLLLLWLLSTTIARPLKQLRRASLGVVKNTDDLSAFPLAVLTRNETGELTESVNTMVSEIERQRRSTQETLSLLDSMLLNAPVGLAFFDREFRYVRVNSHLEKMNARPESDHIGKSLREFVGGLGPAAIVDRVEAQIEHVFRTGEAVADCEISGMLPAEPDRARSWLCNFYPVRTKASEVRWVGVTVVEITERLRGEEAMRRSEKLAAAGRLAASIAHEINNPLESVTNLLYLLANHASLDAEAHEYTRLAQQELARVAEITQQTLRFYRQSTVPLEISVADVLKSVLVLHQGRLQAARVEVQRRTEHDVRLYAFAGELRQLFANLVGNAADAMPRGGRLHVRVKPALQNGRRGVCVTVADTGVGMTESVRRRIFEPFFTTKEATGTGLGLWVSDEILKKHRGAMQVRSRVAGPAHAPAGTVFRVFLPLDGVPRKMVVMRPNGWLSPQSVA